MKARLIPEARMIFLASSTLAPSTKFWLVNSTEECWSELGQSEAALNEFEATLAKEPNRFRTLYGAARSALLAGNPVKARIYNQQLVEICRNADADRPELREARQELAAAEGPEYFAFSKNWNSPSSISLCVTLNDVYTSFMPRTTVPRPCACTSIKKLSRTLGRLYDAALAGSRMNITQLAILRCIDRRKEQPLMHVAKELEMDRSSLYRALEPMLRDEWVKITAGPDARSRSAVITRKGYQLLAKAAGRWEQVQIRLVERFGLGKWASFAAEIDRFRECACASEKEMDVAG